MVALATLLTLAIAPGVLRLEIRTDGHALVPAGAPAIVRDQAIRATFLQEDPFVVLIRSDPSDVASAIELGRHVMYKIRQNLFWALFYNVLAIPLAAGVFARWGLLLPPEIAGAAMALSSITVILNSLDMKRWRPVAA